MEDKDVPAFEEDHSVERVHVLKALVQSARSILDVGCGYGYALQRMQKLFPHADLTGVDACGETLRKASSFAPDIAFEEAALPTLPFDDRSFEWVFCHHTLEHLVDEKAAAAELMRVADKGVLVAVPLETKEAYEDTRARTLAAGRSEKDCHKHYSPDPIYWVHAFVPNDDFYLTYAAYAAYDDAIFMFVRKEHLGRGGLKR